MEPHALKYKLLILAAAVIFVAGVAGSLWALGAPPKNTVLIKSGGRVLETLDLSREPDRTFSVKTDAGENVIEIKDGKIRVKSADCPDQTCVRMGWLSSAAMPIVCLPHDLVITFADGSGGAVDAIAE